MNRNYFCSFVHLLIFSLTGLAFIHHTSAQIVTYSYETRVTQDSVFLGQQVADDDMLFGRFQFDHCQLAPDGSDISASYSFDIEDGLTMVFNGESFSADEYLIAVDNTPVEDELIVFGCLNAGNFVFLQFTDSTGDVLPESGLPVPTATRSILIRQSYLNNSSKSLLFYRHRNLESNRIHVGRYQFRWFGKPFGRGSIC